MLAGIVVAAAMVVLHGRGVLAIAGLASVEEYLRAVDGY